MYELAPRGFVQWSWYTESIIYHLYSYQRHAHGAHVKEEKDDDREQVKSKHHHAILTTFQCDQLPLPHDQTIDEVFM